MTVKTAPEPKLSLEQMIDQHLALDKQIEDLAAQKKHLANQITATMAAKKLKSALGNSGEGYRLASWMQCDFKPEALEYVRRIKKEGLFVPEPSITKARLRNAFSNGHLTAAQHDKIRSFAGPDYPVNRLYKIGKDREEQDV